MIRSLLLSFALTLTYLFSHAQPVQLVSGTVVDASTGLPIGYAAIVILNTTETKGALSDTSGNFIIRQVQTGRYDIRVTCVGYETAIIREVQVNSSRQTNLTIQLKEIASNLREFVVTPVSDKTHAQNIHALASARMLSVEEARRFAGGFDDPARLASSFAGVATNTNDNGVIIRGNAPKFMQWKMEGIEIPNPNHFGDLKMIGGGVLTALSSQMLANSDFYTGAFPAEYSNALSGVLDISLRKGNSGKRESTFQAGLTGLDASSEGPFKTGGKATYLFNYRYSTLALVAPLLPDNAGGIRYQDLCFKLFFPINTKSSVSIWGIGLADQASADPVKDSAKWYYEENREQNTINMITGAAGATFKWYVNRKTYISTTLAGTSTSIRWKANRLDDFLRSQPYSQIKSDNTNLVFTSYINTKFNAAVTSKTGVVITRMGYNLFLNKAIVPTSAPVELANSKGSSNLLSAYHSSSCALSGKLVLNAGVNAQLFTLNSHYTIEPRIGLRYRAGKHQNIGIAYGLHSRIEKLNYYFNNSMATGEKAVNRNMDFTRAHHIVFSYENSLTDRLFLKIEPYYQWLYSVPVAAGSSVSFINLQNDWFFDQKMQNTGKGENYGIDVSLEKFISGGFYYLATASLFHSGYKGGDGIWRNTRFNRNFVINFLAGKEWTFGEAKNKILSVNSKFTFQGGNRYSPVNYQLSNLNQEVVYDDTRAFSLQTTPAFNLHLTLSYRINKEKTSKEIALKLLNLTGQPDFYGYKYNLKELRADKDQSTVVIPNISFRYEF